MKKLSHKLPKTSNEKLTAKNKSELEKLMQPILHLMLETRHREIE